MDKMNIIVGGRGTGKTTKLIYTSSVLNTPILVHSKKEADRILEMADGLNCEIPEPVVFGEHKNKHYTNGILIDNAERYIQAALQEYLGLQVVACAYSKEDYSLED